MGFWSFLLMATHMPVRIPTHPALTGVDKVVHLFLYTVLAALWTIVLTERKGGGSQVSKSQGILILLGVAAAGLLDEATQPWVGRTFDWYDWAADITGIVLGISLIAWYRARRFGSVP